MNEIVTLLTGYSDVHCVEHDSSILIHIDNIGEVQVIKHILKANNFVVISSTTYVSSLGQYCELIVYKREDN